MLKHGVYITLVLSATLAAAALGLQHGTGWLDRVVQYHKTKFFNEIREMAPVNINAEIRQKPKGYEDSRHWDYDSVIRLLTLIRESETAKPVHQVLRRMLRPSRRLMMSMKESMHRFPSLQNKHNNFYYDVDYTSEEDNAPPLPHIPEEEAVVVVSNPVEARLPSARISVNLLREILEARSRAARQMPTTTTHIIPWMEFVKNRSLTSTEASTSTGGGSDNVTTVETTEANGTDTNSTGATDTADTGGTNDTTVESESDTTVETSSEGGNGTTDTTDNATVTTEPEP